MKGPVDNETNTAPGACSQAIASSPAVSDNCPGATSVCAPASGCTFAKGTNAVTCTVTDADGNTATCSFSITVNDTEVPVVTCPANIMTNTAPGGCEQIVAFTASVSDNCPGATVACTPASGSTFAKGTNTVVCAAADAAGNTNNCSFA